ncbi:hypothetical protein WR25_07154 [Diploscapter pachys]|uniref:Uncharacterized protein n=1 Tax=Diploscapter pachys TaxID=2018661 RepID=A0A2A2J2K4_9BILA|nr:hypothetical protein WR25_07154 [Diploscapter pachys]
MKSLRGLFGKKKTTGDGKENESPEMNRNPANRQSLRFGGSLKGSSNKTVRMASSQEDLTRISPTACFHTANPPKLHRGPKSCPGGPQGKEYICDLDGGDRDKSFALHLDDHGSYRDRRKDYRHSTRENKRGSRYEAQSSAGYSLRHQNQRSNITSEYGSAEPSPGDRSSANRAFVNIDDSEDTDASGRFYFEEQEERRRQENWHNDMRRRAETMEARKNYYKERYYTLKKESERKEKELQMKLKEKDELNQNLQQYLNNERKNNRDLVSKKEELEKLLMMRNYQNDGVNGNSMQHRHSQRPSNYYQNTLQMMPAQSSMYSQPPYNPNSGNFGPFFSSHNDSFNHNTSLVNPQRNLLSMPHAHLNVSNTPSTFAGDAGAGESLSQQHDISQARLLPLMMPSRDFPHHSLQTPPLQNSSYDAFSSDGNREEPVPQRVIDTDASLDSIPTETPRDEADKTLPDKGNDENAEEAHNEEVLSMVSSTQTAKEE